MKSMRKLKKTITGAIDMNNDLNCLGEILAGIDRLAGSVQDISPDAFRDPLRGEARALMLAGLAEVRVEIARAVDAVLDGCPVPDVFRELVARLTMLRRLLPLLRSRKIEFIPPVCIRDAEAIEHDAQYLLRKLRRSDDSYFRASGIRWFHDAGRIAARLRAGTCIRDAGKAARRLRTRAEELTADFPEEL